MDRQGHRYRTLCRQMHALAACRLQMGFHDRTFNNVAVEQSYAGFHANAVRHPAVRACSY